MSGKAKRRTRKPPRRLSAAEIAEINALIEAKHQQTALACQDVFDQEERERQFLLREDHTVGPWPERLDAGATASDGYLYVREGDKVHEVPAGHPFLREVARRDGTIRYAWTGGLTFDPYRIMGDPSLHFIVSRLRGVGSDDFDRVVSEIIDELLDRDEIPLSQFVRQSIIKPHLQNARADPKQRERNRDRALASVIASHLGSVVEVLRDAGFKGAQQKAAEYLAHHWRKIVQQDRRRSRFSSGPALSAWLRRHLGPTKNTPKMSCQRGRSEHSSED